MSKDKKPLGEQHEAMRHKRKAGDRPYCVEARMLSLYQICTPSPNKPKKWGEWRVWSRYETKKDAENGLKALQKRNAKSDWIEYRMGSQCE